MRGVDNVYIGTLAVACADLNVSRRQEAVSATHESAFNSARVGKWKNKTVEKWKDEGLNVGSERKNAHAAGAAAAADTTTETARHSEERGCKTGHEKKRLTGIVFGVEEEVSGVQGGGGGAAKTIAYVRTEEGRMLRAMYLPLNLRTNPFGA